MVKAYVLAQSGIASAVVAAALVAFVVRSVKRSDNWSNRIQPGDDWDFSESWASTATVGTAGFAAFFASSDVMVALKGDKATVAPVIVVASAVALGLVTAAPLVVKAASDAVKGESSRAIAAAAGLTVGAAVFEGMVIVWLAQDLTELGAWGTWPTRVAGLATGVLLIAYSFRSLRTILASPTPEQVSEAMQAAEEAAHASAIALAVAEAKAVAAATARQRLALAPTHGEGWRAQDPDLEQFRTAAAGAAVEEEQAREEAVTTSKAAAVAASAVPLRRRAAIL